MNKTFLAILAIIIIAGTGYFIFMKHTFIAFLGFLSLVALPVSAQTWSAPTLTPPNGNASTPVNIGTTAQVKNGGLSVNAFTAWLDAYFAGNVGIGTVTPLAPLD